jgi:branched-chain amino acid transport system ATP-binding protein
MSAILEASGVCFGYGRGDVVRELDMTVDRGEVVALFGANGAGKTTTIRGLSSVLRCSSGTVTFDGRPAAPNLVRMARNGMALIPEERSVISNLSVEANLRIGRGDRPYALSIFPELEPLLKRRAGLLSGGEQQMLTLARALSRRPKLLLVDELSLGLAPLAVARLLEVVRTAAGDGLAVLLVEQRVDLAMQVADRCYVLQRGVVKISGPTEVVRSRLGEVREAYLETAGTRASGSSRNASAPASEPNPVSERASGSDPASEPDLDSR